MEVTQIYAELVVIGMENVTGFLILLANIVGIDAVLNVCSKLDSAIGVVIAICLFYISGLLCDRFADILFQSTEDRLRKESGITAKSVLTIKLNDEQREYFLFCRNRIRILRSTAINSLFIGVNAIIFIFLYVTKNVTLLLGLTLCVSVGAFGVCMKSYKIIVSKYYGKANVIDIENRNEHKGKSVFKG